MSNSFFQFRQFTVRQEHCAMKVGTDGTLLGAWARGGNRVLDIGTGTGLIALMMAQRFPKAYVTAIDIDADACRQAHENALASPFAERISVEHVSLQRFCDERLHGAGGQHDDRFARFDSIVSNPPFFVHSLRAPDAQRSVARHADTLSYADLFGCVARLLAHEGEFSAIVPFDCREPFMAQAYLHGLHLARLCAVKTTPRKQPRRYLLAFCRHSVHAVEQTEGVIDDAPNQKSAWYSQLTRDFYL